MSHDLIYLAPHPWDTIAQRPQHLARALAQHHRILVVGPVAPSIAGTLGHLIKRERQTQWRGSIVQRAHNLWTYTLPRGLPLTMDSLTANRLGHALVTGRVRAHLASLRFTKPKIVVGWPLSYPFARALGSRVVIYDCMDNFPAFPMSAQRRRIIVANERALVRRANALVTTSRSLAALWSTRGYQAQIIPNGVTPSFFESVAPAQEIAALPGPRLVYIGLLGPWLDTALLLTLARRHPDWSIIMIGPTEIDLKPLRAAPNIHLLGPRSHESLPYYLAAADACLIPFIISPLTRAVNPVKLYEYLAAGVPVISTPLPEVAAFAEVCAIAETADQFTLAVEDAVRESPTDQRRQQRRALAAVNTWSTRAAAYTDLLDTLAGA